MNLYSKIIGTGSYLPPKRVTNNELADQLAADGIETSDEWIVSRSGISARHYADAGVLSSDLAVTPILKGLWRCCVVTVTVDDHGNAPVG